MVRVMCYFEEDEYEAVVELSRVDCRTVAQELRHLILETCKVRGVPTMLEMPTDPHSPSVRPKQLRSG